MSVAKNISESIEKSSWIRKMFEEGASLKAKFGEENVFDFSIGNPDLQPPEDFFKEIRKIGDGYKSSSNINEHGYMPNAGYPESRAAIAKNVSKDHDIQVKGEHIIMTCGAAGGLNVVLKTILNASEEVIIPKPYFAEYEFYINNHNGKMTLVNCNKDFSLNIDNIESAINNNTRAILINTPNNPTGKVYTEEDIISLSNLLSKYNQKTGKHLYLISDEPYRKIVYDGIEVPSILKHYPQSIVVDSFSKTLSIAGERIGYIAVNPACEEIDTLMGGLILANRILGFVNAPAIIQRVVVKLLNISSDIEIYKRRRDIFLNGLKDAGYDISKPDGAFYIFCKSPIEDDVQFVKHLQKYNVLVVPGVGFGGPGYFRISYAVPEKIIEKSIPKFKEAINTID